MVTLDDNADAPDAAQQRTRRRLRVLAELAEIGLVNARGLREQTAVELARPLRARAAWTPPGAGPAPAPKGARDIALAYARAAKAVRMTLLLEERLMEPAREPAASPEAANSGAEPAGAGQLAGRKPPNPAVKDVSRDRVERAIDAEATGDAAERLRCELNERLEDEDEMAELDGLSFAEIIVRICKGLGLSPDAILLADAEAERADGRERAADAAGAEDRRPGPGSSSPPSRAAGQDDDEG
jgi:hypothetical protein